MGHITLKIVTPQRTVFDGSVDEFSAPGVLGTFQVLRSHAPIVSRLQPGMLRLRTSEGEERYYISGGFLELHQNAGTVLADTAERSSEINIAEAESMVERIRQRYADHEEGYTSDIFHRDLDAAVARLKVAQLQ